MQNRGGQSYVLDSSGDKAWVKVVDARFLSAGITCGAFAPVDVEPTATLLFDVLHGAFDAIASDMDRQQVMDATRRIVHRTLAPDRSEARAEEGGGDQ
jgi:hypothetical protein